MVGSYVHVLLKEHWGFKKTEFIACYISNQISKPSKVRGEVGINCICEIGFQNVSCDTILQLTRKY